MLFQVGVDSVESKDVPLSHLEPVTPVQDKVKVSNTEVVLRLCYRKGV